MIPLTHGHKAGIIRCISCPCYVPGASVVRSLTLGHKDIYTLPSLLLIGLYLDPVNHGLWGYSHGHLL